MIYTQGYYEVERIPVQEGPFLLKGVFDKNGIVKSETLYHDVADEFVCIRE